MKQGLSKNKIDFVPIAFLRTKYLKWSALFAIMKLVPQQARSSFPALILSISPAWPSGLTSRGWEVHVRVAPFVGTI